MQLKRTWKHIDIEITEVRAYAALAAYFWQHRETLFDVSAGLYCMPRETARKICATPLLSILKFREIIHIKKIGNNFFLLMDEDLVYHGRMVHKIARRNKVWHASKIDLYSLIKETLPYHSENVRKQIHDTRA